MKETYLSVVDPVTLRRHGDLSEGAEHAEGSHAIARLHRGARGCAAHDPRHLAARDERQRRLELILAPRLQQLGERDPGGAHVNNDPLTGREHVRLLGLGNVRELERTLGPIQVDYLQGAHGRGDATRPRDSAP